MTMLNEQCTMRAWSFGGWTALADFNDLFIDYSAEDCFAFDLNARSLQYRDNAIFSVWLKIAQVSERDPRT